MELEISEYAQGLWTFPDFETYKEEWIVRNMLPDLKTVFEGARARWVNNVGTLDGRGYFVLATSLFALFDHLGMFLAKNKDDSLQTRYNISRMAQRLESTKDIDMILGHLGRNALVHGAWPQTTLLMDSGSWGFGLNISADPDESSHRLLTGKRYRFPTIPASSRLLPILKIRLNVHTLRRELEEYVTEGSAFAEITPDIYSRVQELAVEDCRSENWNKHGKLRAPRGLELQTFEEKKKKDKEWFRHEVEDQIRSLVRKAQHAGIWPA